MKRLLGIFVPLALLLTVIVLVVQRRGPRDSREITATPFGKATRSVELYFATSGGAKLTAEDREIAVGGGRIRVLLEALLAGSRTGLRDLFPEESAILGAYEDGSGGVVVDLPREALTRKTWSATEEVLAISSIAKTIGANTKGIDRLTILIDGEPAATLAGHVDLSEPISIRDWW